MKIYALPLALPIVTNNSSHFPSHSSVPLLPSPTIVVANSLATGGLQ